LALKRAVAAAAAAKAFDGQQCTHVAVVMSTQASAGMCHTAMQPAATHLSLSMQWINDVSLLW
jgi:hypothetical protein